MARPGYPWTPARRIPRGATGSPALTYQPIDEDGEPAAAAGTVTVAVTTSDGTAVAGVGTPSTQTSTEEITATLPASALASVEWLEATWTDDGNAVHTEVVEVCGGTLGTIAQITDGDPNLARQANATANIQRERKAIEDLVTSVTRRSPFERFYTERLSGTGRSRLLLSWPDTLEITWAREYDDDGTTTTALTAAELAAISLSPGGLITRTDGGVWESGERNWEVGYRWGWAGGMPHDLRLELYRAIRARIATKAGGIPDRATSMSTADGIDYNLATPGLGPWTTGLPDVDEKLKRYAWRGVGVG